MIASMVIAPIALLWIGALLLVLLFARRIRHFDSLPKITTDTTRLSVIVAARNEAAHIETALSSLLQQDMPALEIIAVNDRSTDATGAILDRLARHHRNLAVIHIEELPQGWLGKNHALQRGMEAASGEILLFTDADVHFAPGTLARASTYMQRGKLDHLVTTPRLLNADASMRIMMTAFTTFFFLDTQPWQAANPRSKRSIGIGAFNMVRRETLLHCGSFEPIRLRPDDDVMLGRLLKQHGGKAEFVFSDGEVAVQWYANAAEAVSGLEKNSFAYFNYNVIRTLAMGALTLIVNFIPLFSLVLLPGIAGWLSLCGAIAMFSLASLGMRRAGFSAWWGITLPVGSVLLVYAMWRSMWVTVRRDGIIWRDTFYPLAELRRQR